MDERLIDARAVQYKLMVEQGQSLTWSGASENDDDPDNVRYHQVEFAFSEIEMEVLEWLYLNQGLNRIEITFDSGVGPFFTRYFSGI